MYLVESITSEGTVFSPSSPWKNIDSKEVLGRRIQKQERAMIAMCAVHFLENILLIIPLCYQMAVINARHSLLQKSIWTLDTENESFRNCLTLLIASFVAVLLSPALQLGSYHLFIFKGSLWSVLMTQAAQIYSHSSDSLQQDEENSTGENIQLEEMANDPDDQIKRSMSSLAHLEPQEAVTVAAEEEGVNPSPREEKEGINDSYENNYCYSTL